MSYDVQYTDMREGLVSPADSSTYSIVAEPSVEIAIPMTIVFYPSDSSGAAAAEVSSVF